MQNILDEIQNILRRPNTKDFDRACRNAKYFAFDLCAWADLNPEILDCRASWLTALRRQPPFFIL
jgi:hypothetical protein